MSLLRAFADAFTSLPPLIPITGDDNPFVSINLNLNTLQPPKLSVADPPALEAFTYCYARGVTSSGELVLLVFYKLVSTETQIATPNIWVKRVSSSFLGELLTYPVREISEALADIFIELSTEEPIVVHSHPFQYLDIVGDGPRKGFGIRSTMKDHLRFEELKYIPMFNKQPHLYE